MERSQPLLVYLANLWRAQSHTPTPSTVSKGTPTSFSSSPPPSKMREEKKLLLVMPHLPPKLLNFIPRTNKSIFIAAGGAGSGLAVLPFLFFKVLLNLLGSSGMPPLPEHTPPSCLFSSWPSGQGWVPPDLLCSPVFRRPSSPQPAYREGGKTLPASCLFGIL